MSELAIRAYTASVRRQMAAASGPRDQMLDEPGLMGLLRDEARTVSLLVLDDRALPRLQHLLRGSPSGVIKVLEAASSYADVLTLRAAYDAGATSARLEASAAGASMYRSLRFENAGPATQFSRAAQEPL